MDKKVLKSLATRLERDLCVYDLETTGLDTNVDQILQFHATRIEKGTGKTKELTFLCKPTCPIHPKAQETHGISEEKLEKAPKFSFFVKNVLEFFKDADIAHYNGNGYDNLILGRQMAENGIKDFLADRLSFDAFEVYKSHINKKLVGALAFYCGSVDCAGAHDAHNDVEFTIRIIDEQLKKEDASPTQVIAKLSEKQKERAAGSLDRYLTKDGDDYVLNFSKNKGTKLSKVDKGFIAWVLKNDFPEALKDIMRQYK